MYHEAFEVDSDMQKWESGCWIRYKMFENCTEAAPTVDVPDRKVGKWIPCKKKMPKPNEVVGGVAKYYLVQTEYGDMMVACYNAEGDERWWEQMYHFKPIEDEIVAWMELPEEYKEGGEDEHTD